MTNFEKVVELMKELMFASTEGNPFCQAIHKIRQEENCAGMEDCKACTEWLKQEYKTQILTDKEREYLSAVIRPFRDRIKYIMKEENSIEEWISITMEVWSKPGDEDYLIFPDFQAGTMYKGMKAGYMYTLEELKLYDELPF